MSTVLSINSGDHRAAVLRRRDALVEGHLELVKQIAKAVAAGLPKRFELDDLIQTGMIGLLHAATRFRPEAHHDAPFEAYARKVIRGAILDSVRRGKWVENTRASCEEMPHPSYAPDFEGELDRERRAGTVQRAVSTLSDRQQTVVALHYREDLRFPEVGQRLGVCKSRASQIHCDAVRHLRAELAEVTA